MACDHHSRRGEALPSGVDQARRKGFWANLLLVLGSLTVGLIALELALAATHYRYLTHPRTDYPSGYFINDPELGADLAPNWAPATFRMRGPSFPAFTNHLGCFDHDGPAGDGYLLAVGDSSTWGYAPLEDKWTSHLETLTGRRILKCGVSGTGPRYQQIKARRTIDKVGRSPAVILVLYDTWNDLNDDVVFPGYGVVEGYRGHTLKSLDLRDGTLVRHTPEEFERKYRRYVRSLETFDLERFLTQNLTLAAMIGEVLSAGPQREASPIQQPILERRYDLSLWNIDPARYPWVNGAIDRHLDNIRALRRLAEQHGAALVLITDGIPDDGLHARLRDFLAEEIAYHLDLAEPMAQAADGRRLTWHHDSHWNPYGNRLAAEIIHRYLQDQDLL